MDVIDIINLMAVTGVGLEEPTPSDQAVFLKYLNLAHLDLYKVVAVMMKPLLLKKENISTDINGAYAFVEMPFTIEKVVSVINKKELSLTTISSIQNLDILVENKGVPYKFFWSGNGISIYPNPEVATELAIWVVKNANILNLGTRSSEIPYPATFHDVLLNGANYYLFQSESGFKNVEKMRIAEERWEKGKTMMIDYLQRFQVNSPSTYSHI